MHKRLIFFSWELWEYTQAVWIVRLLALTIGYLISRCYLKRYSSNDDWVLSTFDKGFVRDCWYDLLAKFFMVYMVCSVSFHWTVRVSRTFEETFFNVFEIYVSLSWSELLVWLLSLCKELDHWMTNRKGCRMNNMQWCICSIWEVCNAGRSRLNSCLLDTGSGAQHCANSDRLAEATTIMHPTLVMMMVLSMFSF